MDAWPGGTWGVPTTTPAGLDEQALLRAVERHQGLETPGVRDMGAYLEAILAGQPFPHILGPVKDGAGASGVCVYRGQLVAAWGDPAAVEMSFSVTKTYLSLVAGVAFDQGLLGVHEPVVETVDHPAFTGPRHEQITWAHLLQQTSEWAGSLWEVPWWADPQGGQPEEQPLGHPGSVWAYNDVRINLLALALTHLFRRSLPGVLATEVMEPVGATGTWQWYGYHNSTVVLDGRDVLSVSGGAHWGGGLWASALDHARVGLLYLRRGRWQDRRVLSEAWVDLSWQPCPVKQDYGLLWWRNDLGTVFPSAPRTGRCARGNEGRQLIWIDPARDLVIVSRWTEDVDRLLAELSATIAPSQ